MATKYYQIFLKESLSDYQDMFIDDTPSIFLLLVVCFQIPCANHTTIYSCFLGSSKLLICTRYSNISYQKNILMSLTSSLMSFTSLLAGSTSISYRDPFPCSYSRISFPFLFQKMLDFTEPIYHAIDSSHAQMLIFGTSSIKFYVSENNPKAWNSLIKRPKVYY